MHADTDRATCLVANRHAHFHNQNAVQQNEIENWANCACSLSPVLSRAFADLLAPLVRYDGSVFGIALRLLMAGPADSSSQSRVTCDEDGTAWAQARKILAIHERDEIILQAEKTDFHGPGTPVQPVIRANFAPDVCLALVRYDRIQVG